MSIPLADLPFLLAPRYLSGMTIGDWGRLLRAHRCEVDAAFWPRAAVATLGAFVTSAIKRIEDRRSPGRIDEEIWRRPVVILGLPRSGTTHLFQVLARDPQLCYPTRFDVFNPHTLLTLRRFGIHRLLACVPGRRRAMDNVMTHWLSPEEDDIALGLLAGRGDRIDEVFPRHVHFPPTSPAVFQTTLKTFTRKLVEVHGRPVLLKSPRHTERIPEILEAFPEARFVTILRDPRALLASYLAMVGSVNTLWCTLQWPPPYQPEEILDILEASVPKYFADRRAIPNGQLVEIRHEDLVADERATLGRIYDGLGLPRPCSASVRSTVADRPVPRSRHPPLAGDLERRLRQVCAAIYEAGWYEAPPTDES